MKGLKKMGKKRQIVSYDRKAISNLSLKISKIRKPVPEGHIPDLKIDLDKLEETIKNLPKKEKEALEKFWGLIPGTVNHGAQASSRKGNDVAYYNMLNAATDVMRKLLQFEYMRLYEETVDTIVKNIVTKIDKTGAEEVSDIDALKYVLILIIFIASGPRLVFEELDYKINLEAESNGYFDEYALLETTWNGTAQNLPDHSICLKLLMNAVEMFDVKDVVAMKRYIRLPVGKELDEIETPKMQSFKEIRFFKEKLFPNGSWEVTTFFIYGSMEGKPNLSKLVEHFGEFRSDWKNVEKYKVEPVLIETSEGEKTLDCYEIEGWEFTDIYEIMFLYLSRNYL